MEPQPAMPPAPATEYCYRHPAVATGVHCTRCGRAICTECMIPAPVGYHCPSCVSDARKEFRKGPGRRIAVANAKTISVTTLLLAAIVGMYLVEVAVGGAASLFAGPNNNQLVKLGASVAAWPAKAGATVGIAEGQYWRLFTTMFLHGGLIHLAFNAYALWIFGTILEEEFGRTRFALVYLLTGLFAGAASYAFAQVFVDPAFGAIAVPAVGASGAIFGIFGAFVAFNWRRRHTPLAAARLRMAAVLIVFNAAIGIYFSGTIDWHAHVGGFVAGLLVGYAAEGFGRLRNERVAFAVGCGALVIATVVIALWKTAQIHQGFPGAF